MTVRETGPLPADILHALLSGNLVIFVRAQGQAPHRFPKGRFWKFGAPVTARRAVRDFSSRRRPRAPL